MAAVEAPRDHEANDDKMNILQLNLERERTIKRLKDQDSKLNAAQIADLLAVLRSDYRKLIVNHTAFIFKEKKDVDTQMWKNCFYKQIEDFRRSIRKNSSDLSNSQPSDPRVERQRFYLVQLTTALISFLSDSTVFYQDMMLELESRVGDLKRIGGMPAEVDFIVKCVYRCLLYLGDLSRYRELYSENSVKNFSEAEKYYERAALMFPNSGNAQNQLAVLATYGDAEFVAIYHYCRSILVQQPFTGGFENLMTMYGKNAVAFATLKKQKMLVDVGSSKRSDKEKKIDTVKLKAFLTKFIHLHGLLFDWATQMHRYHSQTDSATPYGTTFSHLKASSAQPEGFGSTEINVEMYVATLHSVLEEYDQQLAQSALSDQILVKLLVICIFSVHFSAEKDQNILLSSAKSGDSSSTTGRSREKPQSRSVPECLALISLFGVINRTAARINSVMTSSEKGKKAAMNRLLPMLSVFSEWASIHFRYMLTLESTTAGKESSSITESSHPLLAPTLPPAIVASINQQFDVSKDLLRTEIRARSGMRASMSSLFAIFVEDMNRNDAASELSDSELQKQINSQFLREHIELKGFLPLAELYEERFKDFDPLSRSIPLIVEPLARYCREYAVCEFIERTKTAAARESQESAAVRQQQILLHQQHTQQTREKAEAIFPILSSKKSQKFKDRDREKGRDRDRDRDRSRDNKKKDKELNKESEIANSSSHRRRGGGGENISQSIQPSSTTTRRGPPAGVMDDDEGDDNEEYEDGDDAALYAPNNNNNDDTANFENEFPPLPGSAKEKAVVSDPTGANNELSFAKALSRERVPVVEDNTTILSKSVLLQHRRAVDSSRDEEVLLNASDLSFNNNFHHLNDDSNMSNFDFNQSSLLYQANQSQIVDSQQTYYEEEDLDDLVVFRPTFSRALSSQTTANSQPDLFSLGPPPLLEPPPLISTRGFSSSLGVLNNNGRMNDYNSSSTTSKQQTAATVGDYGGVFGNSSNSHLGMDWQPWGMESSSNKAFNMGSGSLYESSLKTDNIITHPNSAKNSTTHLSEMLGGEGYHSYWDENAFDPVQSSSSMSSLSKKESVDIGYNLLNSNSSKLGDYQQPGMYYLDGYGSYNMGGGGGGGGAMFAQTSDANIYQSTSSLVGGDSFRSQSTAPQMMMPPPPPGLATANQQHNPAAVAVPLPPGFSHPNQNNTFQYSQSSFEAYNNAGVDATKYSLNVE